MNGKGSEPFEYRSETEIITYPEYNVLNEELGHAPEYDESSKILSAQAGTKLPLLRNLIVSAFKGGGAVVCALLLAGAVAANHGDMGDTAKQAAQIVETGQRQAVSQKPGLSPDDFHALWSGDPDGPHDYEPERKGVRRRKGGRGHRPVDPAGAERPETVLFPESLPAGGCQALPRDLFRKLPAYEERDRRFRLYAAGVEIPFPQVVVWQGK